MRLSQLAELTGTELRMGSSAGSAEQDIEISNVSTIEAGGTGDLAFLANAKYRRHLQNTDVSAVVLSAADAEHCPEHLACLVSDNPYLSYAKIATQFLPKRDIQQGIHPSAVVADSAVIDPSAAIGPLVTISAHAEIAADVSIAAGSVIGENVIIAERTEIEANVTIWHDVKIGQDCLIHSGVVIGSDGFGNARDGAKWVKIPQLGSVILHDRVEVGANTTIDRGALEDTIIEAGVRLDNQVQIGHNAIIGEDTAMAAGCGIAGSAKVGKRLMMGGMSGIAGHIEVGDDSMITGMTMVSAALEPKSMVSSGIPARPTREWRRTVARVNNLDKLEARIKRLEKLLDDSNS